MKTRSVLLLLSIVLGLGIVTSAEATVPATLHYKVKLKSASFGNMGVRELWLKGGKMRCNITSAGLPLTIVKNDRGVFLIHAWNKVAGKYPGGSPRGNPSALLPGPNGSPKTFLRAVKAVRIAREKVGKQLCDVYSYTQPTTKRACKLWVAVKSGKPAKLWMKGKHQTVDTVTATYTAFEQGVKISDSLFDVPKGYAIRPMPKRELESRVTNRQPHIGRPGI